MTTNTSPQSIIADALAANARLLADIVSSPMSDDSFDDMNAAARIIEALAGTLDFARDAENETAELNAFIALIASRNRDNANDDNMAWQLAWDLSTGAECAFASMLDADVLM